MGAIHCLRGILDRNARPGKRDEGMEGVLDSDQLCIAHPSQLAGDSLENLRGRRPRRWQGARHQLVERQAEKSSDFSGG